MEVSLVRRRIFRSYLTENVCTFRYEALVTVSDSKLQLEEDVD